LYFLLHKKKNFFKIRLNSYIQLKVIVNLALTGYVHVH